MAENQRGWYSLGGGSSPSGTVILTDYAEIVADMIGSTNMGVSTNIKMGDSLTVYGRITCNQAEPETCFTGTFVLAGSGSTVLTEAMSTWELTGKAIITFEVYTSTPSKYITMRWRLDNDTYDPDGATVITIDKLILN